MITYIMASYWLAIKIQNMSNNWTNSTKQGLNKMKAKRYQSTTHQMYETDSESSYVTGDDYDDLLTKHSELEKQLADAKREAEHLAMSIWKKRYKETSPNFELCDTVAAVLS